MATSQPLSDSLIFLSSLRLNNFNFRFGMTFKSLFESGFLDRTRISDAISDNFIQRSDPMNPEPPKMTTFSIFFIKY